jgi:hypothetical protein
MWCLVLLVIILQQPQGEAQCLLGQQLVTVQPLSTRCRQNDCLVHFQAACMWPVVALCKGCKCNSRQHVGPAASNTVCASPLTVDQLLCTPV